MTTPGRELRPSQLVVTEEPTAQIDSIMPRLWLRQNYDTLPPISRPRLVGTTVPLFGPSIHPGLACPQPAPAPPIIPPAAPPVLAIWPTITLDAGLVKTAATERQRFHGADGPLKARPVPNGGSVCRCDAALDPNTVFEPPTCCRTARWISRAGTVGYDPGIERAEDDAAIMPQPTRHIDYLSHDWREEEVWSSWKYIVSQRPEGNNGRRLENALWRIWTKAKKKLGTVRPETINWLKDSDVTWLYGPQQGGGSAGAAVSVDHHRGKSSESGNSTNKKPILKTRSVIQAILDGLCVAPVAPIQDKDKGVGITPLGGPVASCYQDPFCSPQISRENDGITATSDASYSTRQRKRVRFKEQVEQRIIAGFKGEDRQHDIVTRS
ncbi:uncharacterized protein DNG_05143 [Cephalotrichum gorgonifer]|uniref:Nitrogen regulatory protein areA GATA-like domain-containing protein n=1 Tax=Cephalotrichum gorgonifer TaxID=2041049 RepID=A0AAE8N077_9PEZI|nr:uncharacterized protein DNG_05143 [Cephalotrichum gorgonifer]